MLEPAEDAFPQMRAAAIGLVKSSFLRAIQSQHGKDDVFASRALVGTVGGYVFRPNPPNLFEDEKLEMEEFIESENQEAVRLVECLGLYYVVLLRDSENKVFHP